MGRMVIVDHPEVKVKGVMAEPKKDMTVNQDWKKGMPKKQDFYTKREQIMAKLE